MGSAGARGYRNVRTHPIRATTATSDTGHHAFRWSLLAMTGLGLVLLTLPTVALVWRAFGAWDALDRPQTRDALREALTLSLTTSLIALGIIVALGTPIAFVLARGRSPLLKLADALVDLPIILPPAVAGIALLTAFGRNGILGGFLSDLGITVSFSTTAVVLAQIFVSAPFYIRTARAGFLRVEHRLEEAAADLGAPPHRVFLRVTLPLARTSLIAGAVLAWARALGEFGATIMFAGNRQGVTQTMPLAIYERFGAGDLPAALVLSAILLGTSVVFLLAIRLMGESSAGR
jgi:molybdate transport system permease protein